MEEKGEEEEEDERADVVLNAFIQCRSLAASYAYVHRACPHPSPFPFFYFAPRRGGWPKLSLRNGKGLGENILHVFVRVRLHNRRLTSQNGSGGMRGESQCMTIYVSSLPKEPSGNLLFHPVN